MSGQATPKIPLPKVWNGHVRSAVLHLIALARYVTIAGVSAASLHQRKRKLPFGGVR